MTIDPICKQLCKNCQHVLNIAKSNFFRTVIAPTYQWKCGSKKKIDCKDGMVEFDDCFDNYRGDCDRFGPVDEEHYNPKEHLLPKED